MASRPVKPLQVPPGFWLRDDVRTALRTRNIGALFRLVRRHTGSSQTQIGRAVDMEQGYVSKLMNDLKTISAIDVLDRISIGLGMLDSCRMLFGLAPRDPVRAPNRTTDESTLNIGTPDMSMPTYASAMKSFRAADKQVGGGHLYATVVKYLRLELVPRLLGVDHGGDGRLEFTAAAALTEMAGWMAHDAGQDTVAERHFAQSLGLAKIGGDCQLGVHVLASMSHLAHHLGKPADAIRLARRGREALSRGPHYPELEARLLAMQARGLASLRCAEDCRRLLLQAEQTLAVAPTEERSPWVSRFDEGSFASEAARCLRQLGDLVEAQRQAERIIELRPGDRTRSRAFGQLILVTVLVAQGKPEEACTVAQEVLDATQQLGSYLVTRQLLDLKQLLATHRRNRMVADFLVRLDETLEERAWLYQWLTRDKEGQPMGFGERW